MYVNQKKQQCPIYVQRCIRTQIVETGIDVKTLSERTEGASALVLARSRTVVLHARSATIKWNERL